MEPIVLDEYYERPQLFEQVLFRARRAVQSAEWNEAQATLAGRVRRIGNALFKDGDVISGCDVLIDADTGAVTLGGGAIYLRGDVRGVEPAQLTIPTLGQVELGVWLRQTIITELEDPRLLNQVPGAETFHAPGAARLQVTLTWGWRVGELSDGQSGEFYRVMGVTNATLDNVAPPPRLDGVQLALARYDRAATGGTYIIQGLGVRTLEIAAGQQVFSLAEGGAHVDGFEVQRPMSARLAFPEDPDPLLIEAEPHTFLPVNGSMRVDVIYGPLAEIVECKVTAERVAVQVTRGIAAGGLDALPDVSVLQIVAVSQSATTYMVGTDCKLTGNGVDWSLPGAEPAPGSTYTVTYRYLTEGTVTDVDDAGFTLSGAVSGTLVMVDYRHKLPRFDRLVMDRDGMVTRVRGVADLHGPSVPPVPAGTLLLATLRQTWWSLPSITADAPRVMPVQDLMDMSDRLDALYDLVAIERLKTDVTAREPSAAKGLFVDPFLDDDMRDAGVAQTAAVVQGELTLPITPVFPDTLAPDDQHMLTYGLEPVIEQTLATGGIKVNPYMAFAPMPPRVIISPEVDRWTEARESWAGDSVRFLRVGHFVEGVSRATRTTTLSEGIEVLARSQVAAQFLRQVQLRVRIENLGPGEIVDSVKFDGVEVAANLVADPAGVVEHQFVTPANVPAGTKRVEAIGRATGRGVTSFTGGGVITTEVRRRVAEVEEFHVDPVAETFMLDSGRHVGGCDLLFRARGSSMVVVQIRTTQVGLPARTVLAEARLAPGDIRVDGQPTRFTWRPVWLPAGEEFALVVLCDDAETEVAIAQLGKFDPTRQRWVTAQPYQVGVMLSSSNASTWTPHQDSDLWFRLLACRFTATSRAVALGSLSAAQVSDLVALYNAERPAADTRISLRLTASDGSSYALSDGQPMNLPKRLAGDIQVQAILEGTDLRSPVLHRGVQAIFGQLADSATYVSRAFPCGTNTKVRVVCEAFTPGTSTVTAEVQAQDGTWVAVPLASGLDVGDGWEELTHVLTPHSSDQTRVRLTLSGSPLSRPRVRRLRVIVT